jgi:hypothetical protein
MWGARGPFLPVAAMVVAVVTPVVFCATATEKRNKNTKNSWWFPNSLFIGTIGHIPHARGGVFSYVITIFFIYLCLHQNF